VETILIVDDDQFVRTTLKNMLQFLGYETVEAKDGIEGLKVFLRTPIDFVLTDLEMPLMDGGSLAHIIKSKSPSTPVVLVTGSNSKEIKEGLKSKVFDRVINKPFKLAGLFATIESLSAANREMVPERQIGAI